MRLLVGDVGGTHTRLALWEDGALTHVHDEPSHAWRDLAEPAARWLAGLGVRRGSADHPTRACFGVAGPVRDGVCTTTNLPWTLREDTLTHALGMPTRLINDFHAAARGVTMLGPGDHATLVEGDAVRGAPVAVLGAGTGLGEAYVVAETVIPGEGAHAEFGPTDERELRLAAWLIRRHGRASWEDVLSGPGLVNLARFLLEERGETPGWLDGADAAAHVAERCPEAVAWFCALYGAEAGNMALRVLARGGVWLCGGIAPRMLDALRGGAFEQRFRAKGKLRHALDGIPVHVVTHPSLGLLGAAGEALRDAVARPDTR
jgi:glucokinase